MSDRSTLPRVIGAVVLLTLVAGLLAPVRAQGVVVSTGAGFVPGGQTLFATDFTQDVVGDFPRGLKLVKGSLDVVERDGIRMLRSTSPSEFIIPFSGPLPAQFTLEFDIVARGIDCCAGEELAIEGSPTLARTAGSAQLLWHHQWLAILGGGRDMSNSTVKVSETLQAELLGQLGRVQIAFDGPNMKLWTNGVRLYNMPDLAFRRSNVLRVYLGGLDEADRAVYLARIRVGAGGPPDSTPVEAQPRPVPSQPAPSQPAPSQPAPTQPSSQPSPPEAAPSSGVRTVTPVPTPPPAISEAAPSSGARTVTPASPPPPAVDSVPPSARTATVAPAATSILVGTGIGDITGPVAEVGMMGYGKSDQKATGLHMRLYARAFVFANQGGKRVVFVSAELGQLFSSVKQGVLKQLAQHYGTLYDDRNVMISATHTHAGPGGYSHHAMYNLTTMGHVAQNYAAIVAGITNAIVEAHNHLSLAVLSVGASDIEETASRNRSLAAFRLNPEVHEPVPPPEVNPEMTVLGIERDGRPVGAISWFAVHNTSLTQTNTLVSSDHKGYAAYLLEKRYGSIAPLQHRGGFVAAFPNGAEGDLSPNIAGDATTFVGPGKDEFASNQIIGTREFNTAAKLLTGPSMTPVLGEIDFRHFFVPMTGLVVTTTQNRNGMGGPTLCSGAYGASFMAGAEDGPTGMLSEGLALGSTMDFAVLTKARTELVALVSALMPPLIPVITAVMAASSDPCQLPKPVLIPSGELRWTPDILPFQLLRIGPVAIAGIPGEMTVQAGRRLQARILAALAPRGVTRVILTGLANEYSGYITTPEEYDSQQYEGASTLYGRLTFDAYLQMFGQLADAMAAGQPVAGGPAPPDLSLVPQIELQTGVVFDDTPPGETFGRVLVPPLPVVNRGGIVNATFRAGHPKNDLRTNDTYLRIERNTGGDAWELVAWDAMPETTFIWGRASDCTDLCSASAVTVLWHVPLDAQPGTYRIVHLGKYKNGLTGQLVPYQGITPPFAVK